MIGSELGRPVWKSLPQLSEKPRPAVKLDSECKGSQAYVELVGEILSRNGLAAVTP